MKIFSNELEHLYESKGEVITVFDDYVLRGPIEFSEECSMSFNYTFVGEESISRADITICGKRIHLKGLRLEGTIRVEECANTVVLEDIIIRGSIRVSSGAQNILTKFCVISPSRAPFGIQVSNNSTVQVENCHVSNCISGISILKDIYSEDTDTTGRSETIQCTIKDCVFTNNATDILLNVYVHSGSTDNCLTASFYPDSLLRIGPSSQEYRVDVSVSGILETPLQYKTWPIPRSEFPISVTRRGSRLSFRQCHLTYEEGCIKISQDPKLDDITCTPRARKRKERSKTEYTKAEVYYARILSIQPGASIDEVQSAYKKLALLYHPDKNDQGSDRFILIKKARDELIRILDSR